MRINIIQKISPREAFIFKNDMRFGFWETDEMPPPAGRLTGASQKRAQTAPKMIFKIKKVRLYGRAFSPVFVCK